MIFLNAPLSSTSYYSKQNKMKQKTNKKKTHVLSFYLLPPRRLDRSSFDPIYLTFGYPDLWPFDIDILRQLVA